MKRLLIVFLFISCSIYGQDEIHVVSQTRMVKIQPIFQSWKVNPIGTISEMSIPVEMYYPFDRRWSVKINIGQASANGKDMASVSGLSDTQIQLNHYLESSNLVLSLGMNVPTGKRELMLREFNTTALLSQNMLGFETPIFGQGFNLSPGLTWAFPAGEIVVLGLGMSYQIKGGYKPIAKMSGDYNPGGELLITAGLDARTGEAESFSFDLIWTNYKADKIGSDEIFRAGSKIMAAVQYQKYFGRDLLWLFARYRSRSKNHVIVAGTSTEALKIQPDEVDCTGLYNHLISKQISWNFSAEIRLLQKTDAFDRISILKLGIGSDWTISPSLLMPVKLGFGAGRFGNQKSLTGAEISLGLEYRF